MHPSNENQLRDSIDSLLEEIDQGEECHLTEIAAKLIEELGYDLSDFEEE